MTANSMVHNVTWIKLAVSMFDDEKIRIIESMPEGDAIVVIWLKLLTMAGKTNDTGLVYLSEGIPYSEEDLAVILNKPIMTVQLALAMLKRYGLIEVDGSGISILNWEGQQNTAGLDRIREKGRLRQARFRQNQKQLMPGNEAVTLHTVTVTKQMKKKMKKKKEGNAEIPHSTSSQTEDTFISFKANVPKTPPPVAAASFNATQRDNIATKQDRTGQLATSASGGERG